MKKIINNVKSYSRIFVILAFIFTPVFAQTADCKDSFAPAFICDRFASFSNNFSISSLLNLFFSVAIAALVVFILIQIVRAVFKWVSKSGDEKGRGEAIKSISNAIVGGVVLIVAVFGVVFTSDILNIGGKPNPLYTCYNTDDFSPVGGATLPEADIDPATVSLRSTSKIPAVSNVLAYEGKPTAFNETAELYTKKVVFDQKKTDFLSQNLYCRDSNTGKEYEKSYYILYQVGVKN